MKMNCDDVGRFQKRKYDAFPLRPTKRKYDPFLSSPVRSIKSEKKEKANKMVVNEGFHFQFQKGS